MNNKKKWIVAALVMLGVGLVICGRALVAADFDFGKLSTGKYVTKTHSIEEKFQNIRVDLNTEKVVFSPSDDGNCRVVCYEPEKDPCSVRVDSQTLIIEKVNKHSWTLHFGFVLESPEVTIFLPEKTYRDLSVATDTGDVIVPCDFSFYAITLESDTGDISCDASVSGNIKIDTDTGHISVSSLSASGMELKSDTGNIEMSDISLSEDLRIIEKTGNVTMMNVSCRNFTSNGDTGRLIMTNVVASGEYNLQRDTGDIRFESCDAETIYVQTDTGDVTGVLLTEKVFITETDTGRVDVPQTTTGGRCEISTDTGNIRIEIN